MRIDHSDVIYSGFTAGPMIVGILCIIAGVVIYLFPNILELMIAAMLIVFGISMVIGGLVGRPRQTVAYRRFDQDDIL